MPDIYDAGGFGGSLNYGGDMRGPAADSADWMTDKSAAQQKYADLSKEEAKATEKLTGDISTAMTEEQTAADTYKKIQAPVLAKPPEFKTPKMTGKDMLGYGTLIAFMGALFGGAAGARGAMVAMTGAMNGIHQGQQEKAQQAYAEYKANMDALHERNSAILQEWQGINQKFANDANARRTAFEMMVAKDKIPIASMQLEKGNVMDAMKAMDQMHIQAMRLQEADQRLRALMMEKGLDRESREKIAAMHTPTAKQNEAASKAYSSLQGQFKNGTLEATVRDYTKKRSEVPPKSDGGNPTFHAQLKAAAALGGEQGAWASEIMNLQPDKKGGWFSKGETFHLRPPPEMTAAHAPAQTAKEPGIPPDIQSLKDNGVDIRHTDPAKGPVKWFRVDNGQPTEIKPQATATDW